MDRTVTSTHLRTDVGAAGEDAALRVYLRCGFRLLARNWRCRLGELDLVIERDGLLVVCEVKTRTGSVYGGGYEAVTRTKRRKLRQLAEAFLAERDLHAAAVRFDVASIHTFPGRRQPDVVVFQDAF